MKKRFQGRVALVTGAASGIGEGIAQRLAAEGARVVLLDKQAPELESSANKIVRSGGQASGIAVDITSEDQVSQALSRITSEFGRLDIMINSAGVVGPTGTNTIEYSYRAFREVVDINLSGAFLMTKYSLPPMLAQNYGRILLIASIGGKEGNPGMVGYAASKAGVLGLVKAVGKEYAQSGVTVNGLAPAVIATPMNLATAPTVLKYMREKIPMNRLGTVSEVASLACWIVSEEASFNTGFVFDLSGGRATF